MRLFEVVVIDKKQSKIIFAESYIDALLQCWAGGLRVCEFRVFEITIK